MFSWIGSWISKTHQNSSVRVENGAKFFSFVFAGLLVLLPESALEVEIVYFVFNRRTVYVKISRI